MNKKAQLQFAHRCSVLISSGISLLEAMDIIIGMEKSKKKLHILFSIKSNVEKGVSLSKSIIVSKAKFDPTLIAMISYGESGGILALTLSQAGDIMNKRNELKKKLIGSLIYPLFIALATIVMTLFLVMYIFPKILPLLTSMNMTLPLLTRIVEKIYEILTHYGLWLFLGLIICTATFIYYYKTHYKFRYKVEMLLIALPLTGEAIKKYFICSYCRSAGTLLEHGQTLPSIVEHCVNSSTFLPYRRAWSITKLEIMKGIPLAECLRSFKMLFPSIVPDMLAIGERTGSLSSMFRHVGDMYENELDSYIKYLGTIIEPALMIVMGLVVGSVALSIILPIYEITNHLTR